MMICSWSLASVVITYFVHYHAQHQVLRPADYDVTVVPASSADAAPSGDYRLSEDGAYYVRVMTLGSAHYVDRTTSDLLPVFLMGAVGFATAVYVLRRSAAAGAQSH
jgi:hypothetical protein